MLQLKFAFPLAALALVFGLVSAADAPKKKTASKAPAAKSTQNKAPAARSATGKAPVKSASKSTAKSASTAGKRYTATNRSRSTSSYARGRTRGRSPQPVATRYYRGQQSPTQDRLMEIQQALATRGYLQSTPSGAWDSASIDALKRFQEEQNLPPTGKITSLSLIALGLGPKRNPAATTAQQQPAVP